MERQYFDSLDREQFFDKLVRSVAPSVVGYRDIKTAILLQAVMGGMWEELDGTTLRKWINILLAGDPGTAKSRIMQYISRLHPKVVWAGGSRTSTGGLTVGLEDSPIKHGKKIPRPGALVRGHNGIALIDEFDKIDDKDQKSVQGAMEQGVVDVAMVGVQASFPSHTAIFASCNPKDTFFKDSQYGGDLKEQIGISKEIYSRFDLVFTLMDKPDKDRDGEIVEVLWNGARPEKDYISPEVIQKYIAYIRSLPEPDLSVVMPKVREWYVNLRWDNKDERLGARVVNSIKRLSLAFAMFRRSTGVDGKVIVSDKDLKDAQDMYHDMLSNLAGYDTWDSTKHYTNFTAKSMNLRDRILKQIRTQEPSYSELFGFNPHDDRAEIEKEVEYLANRGIIYNNKGKWRYVE